MLKEKKISEQAVSDGKKEVSFWPVAETFVYTVADSFGQLCAIQDRALSLEPKPDFTAALKSEELKGKLFGLYQDKKEKEKENLLPRVLVRFVENKKEADFANGVVSSVNACADNVSVSETADLQKQERENANFADVNSNFADVKSNGEAQTLPKAENTLSNRPFLAVPVDEKMLFSLPFEADNLEKGENLWYR